MENNKALDVMMAKNKRLEEKIALVNEKIAKSESATKAKQDELNSLISEIEKIKSEWEETLKELKQQVSEYKKLNNNLIDIGKAMRESGVTVPLSYKIKHRFLNK